MSETGWKLGVDLADLLSIGKIQLPHIALTYASANRKVAGTAHDDMHIFDGGESPKGDGGSAGQVYKVWSDLRNTLQDVLGHTATHVEGAGRTIVHIANSYAATDAEAAHSMMRAWENGVYGPLHGDPPVDPPSVRLTQRGEHS